VTRSKSLHWYEYHAHLARATPACGRGSPLSLWLLPDSSGLTAEALHGSYQSLADVLDGKLSLELLRRQVRRTADGPTRVRRRQGEPPVGWYRGPWPINVVNVLTATAATYPEFVEAWAHAVRATLDAQLLTTTQPR